MLVKILDDVTCAILKIVYYKYTNEIAQRLDLLTASACTKAKYLIASESTPRVMSRPVICLDKELSL